MNVLIDNTGLHSAAYCFDGRSRGDFDIRGLLQLSQLLIFAEKLMVSGFDGEEILQRTELIKSLIGEGPNASGIFSNVLHDPLDFQSVCDAAANRCANDIETAFQPMNIELAALEPLRTNTMDEMQNQFHDLLCSEKVMEDIVSIRSKALQAQMYGAAIYMLTSSRRLWNSAAKVVKATPNWASGYSRQLEAFFRYYLNDSMALIGKGFYAPAIVRARMMRFSNSYLLTRLNEVVDEAVLKSVGTIPLGVPSLLSVVVERAKGSPLGLIYESLAMRDKTEHFRKWLGELSIKFSEGASAERYSVHFEMEKLSLELKRSMGIVDAPKLAGALESIIVLGLPQPSLSGRILSDWVSHRITQSRISILTDLSKMAAFPSDYYAYEKLRLGCVENNR